MDLEELDDQVFMDGDKRWRVSRLIDLSKDLDVMIIPLAHLNIYNMYPKGINSTMDFVEHVKRVNDADIRCPIILDEEGFIMDGRHRLAKALVEGYKTISAVRFKETPPPCYYVNDK